MSWSRLLTQTLTILGLGLALVIFGLVTSLATASVIGWSVVALAALWLAGGIVRALMERLLWRVGRRLLVSYLMLGLLPLALLIGLEIAIAYLVSGQLAARRAEAEVAAASRYLADTARELDSELADGGSVEDWHRSFRTVSPEVPGIGFAYLPDADRLATGAAEDAARTRAQTPAGALPGTGIAGRAIGEGPIEASLLLPDDRVQTRLDAIARIPGHGHHLVHVRPSDHGTILIYLAMEPDLRHWLHRRTRIGIAFPDAMLPPDQELDSLDLTNGELEIGGRPITDDADADASTEEPGADGPDTDAPADDGVDGWTSAEDGPDPEDGPGGEEGSEQFWRNSHIPTGMEPVLDQPVIVWYRSVELPRIDWGNEDWHAALEGTGSPFPLIIRTSFAREYVELFGTSSADEANLELARTVRAITKILAISTLAVYVFAVALAGFLVFRIARAARRLHDGFLQIEEGRFEHRVVLRGRDQLAALVRSFNRMVTHLEKATSERVERQALERELDLARELQQSLLPSSDTRLGACELAVDFAPAAAIGGDFYHFAEQEEGDLMVAIADVSGHGLGTGIVMSAAQSLLAVLAEEELAAVDLLHRLDRQLGSITDRRTFVTLVLLELDATRSRARITNAGHLPPYRVTPAGEVRTFGSPARPLGLPRLEAKFGTVEAETAPGDLWVLLSDGMIEATNDEGEIFGFERFEALLERCAGSTADEARELLLGAWRRFTKSEMPEDDRTLLVLRIAESSIDAPGSA